MEIKITLLHLIQQKILVEKLQQQKKVDIKFKPIKGADHFYESFSNEFENSINEYISETIETK